MPTYFQKQLIRRRLAWMLMYQKTGNVTQVCRYFGISRKSFYTWLKRYRASRGDPNSLADHSRRPRRSPYETASHIQQLVLGMRKQTHFGPDRIRLFLIKDHNLSVPRSTLYAILKRNGLIQKGKKRRKSPILYSMPSPGYIQADIKFIGGYGPKKFVQYSAQDDATRLKFTRLYRERSNANSLTFLAYICKKFPFKIKTIRTDNDSVFTNRFTGDLKTHPLKLPQEHPFTLACRARGIHHKLNDPACPEQNGKVERSHRTDSEEFYRLCKTFDFQLLVKERKNYDEFFNNRRPHMGLKGITPLQKLNSFREFKSVSYVYS